jgi:hypothetical protein
MERTEEVLRRQGPVGEQRGLSRLPLRRMTKGLKEADEACCKQV